MNRRLFRRRFCALGLLLACPALKAGSNAPPATALPPTIVAGDRFVEDEERTRKWIEFPGANAGPWRLSLRVPTNTFGVGTPIRAFVVYQNISTNRLRLLVSQPGLPYMFTVAVTNQAGRALSITDQALDVIEDGLRGLNTFREMAPGAKMAVPFELQRFFNVAAPGSYRFSATAHGPFIPMPLASGVAAIQIVPPPPAAAPPTANGPPSEPASR